MKYPVSLNMTRHQTGLMNFLSRYFVTWEGLLCRAFERPRITNLILKQSLNIYKGVGSGHLPARQLRLYLQNRHYVRSATTDSCPTTIFSLSSGYGKCGVSVIRVSGSKVKDIIGKMIPVGVEILSRKAVLSKIIDPKTKLSIDKGIVLYFPGMTGFPMTPSFFQFAPPKFVLYLLLTHYQTTKF